MKNLVCFFTFLVSLNVMASHIDSNFRNSLEPGKRKGLHGQVVFGNKTYFMSHIPMLNMPHDIQIVTKVTITDSDGKKVERDFSQETFSIKPALAFSLNDFVKGTLKKFRATIYKGSFELNGTIEEGLQGVMVEVTDYLIVRHLPSEPSTQTFNIEEEDQLFKVNLIGSQKNIQEIINGKSDKVLWCVKGPDFFQPCDPRS